MSQWPSTRPNYGTEPAIYSVHSCPWPQTRGENPGYVCSPWGQDDAHSQQDAEQGNTSICWIFFFPYSHLVYVHSAFYGCTEQTIHLFVCPSIHQSACLSVHTSNFIHPIIYPYTEYRVIFAPCYFCPSIFTNSFAPSEIHPVTDTCINTLPN